MLLQIAEPGESNKAACAQRVIGIDLGTTHSLVAYVKDGMPVCIADKDGEVLLPSVVHYQNQKHGAPLVGAQAVNHSVQHPQDTIVSVKRWMGKAKEDLSKDTFAYRLDQSISDSVIRWLVTDPSSLETFRSVTPIEVSAEILRALKDRAELELSGNIDGVVITVPAYFDDAQRQATKDAGRLAGLPVLRLLNEPTAAALAYGLEKRARGIFAVYDLGGGTFDISILELREGVFTVLSTAGDTALGGDDMDHVIATRLIEKHPRRLPLEGLFQTDAVMQRQMLSLAKDVKHRLTTENQVDDIRIFGEPEPLSFARSELESAILPLLDRTGFSCKRALKDAGLFEKNIDGVILVGGATRIPSVQNYVENLFHQKPLSDVDPDQVVALGAAIQAEAIANQRSDVLLIDVTPLSLGLVLLGDIVEKIIPRNSRIPTAARQVFTTYADFQTGFDLHVVQGERDTAAGCRSLARFQLTGIKPLAAGMARLEVTFLVDENGLLQVSAKELISGKEAHVEVTPSYGLSQEKIEQMLLDSYQYAEQDIQARRLSEKRVEAERVLLAFSSAFLMDQDMLSLEEKTAMEQAVSILKDCISGTDPDKISTALHQLEEASRDFAERRVSVRFTQAISGKSIEDVV